MVEVEGERVLAASCQRKAAAGMKVKTASERAKKSREMVFELLMADQPERETSHDPDVQVLELGRCDERQPTSRFPASNTDPLADYTHSAIAVNLDACINCGLCVRACREVQVNDVIGMAYPRPRLARWCSTSTRDGPSTCVACGECVQACPTGALMEKNLVDKKPASASTTRRKAVDTLCPYCGVGCQTTAYVKDNKILYVDGRNGPANENRLCVKGRFGFDYIHHPDRLTKPLIRRDGVAKDGYMQIRARGVLHVLPRGDLGGGARPGSVRPKSIPDRDGGNAIAGFGSAKGSNEEAYLFQKLIRQGFNTNNVDHCTRLCHASSVAALMEGLNSGAVSAPFTAANDARMHHRDRRASGAEPSGRRDLPQERGPRGAKLIIMDPRGQNQGIVASREPHVAVQARAATWRCSTRC